MKHPHGCISPLTLDPREAPGTAPAAETNVLHPGKVRRVQLPMGKHYLESNKRPVTSGDCPPSQGCAPCSAPLRCGCSPSAQHPAPTTQRPLKPPVARILLQEAFARPEPLLPALAALPFLPVLSVSRISAASDASQQQRDWGLSPAAPATQTCLPATGSASLAPSLCLTSCGQTGETEVQFIIAFHCFFPLFSAAPMRNAARSHPDCPLMSQSRAVSSRRHCGSEEGEQE